MGKRILPLVVIALLLSLAISPTINAIAPAVTSGFKDETLLSDTTKNQRSISEDFTHGCIFQGYGENTGWKPWFENAQGYFSKWTDGHFWSVVGPSLDEISYPLSTLEAEYFYVIAHSGGKSTQFLANRYTYYTADHLREDMSGRPPIKLAILCCCEAMTNTGPRTLSYEFRKGQMEGTAVIGYTNLSEFIEKNGDFKDALSWQEDLFNYIDRGYTVKRAFDKACKKFERDDPSIANYVKFEGDPSVKVTTAVSVDSDVKIPTDPVDISGVTTDAGMSLTVELEEPASPSNVFDMVPKNYIDPYDSMHGIAYSIVKR